jgi:hypothetical protein
MLNRVRYEASSTRLSVLFSTWRWKQNPASEMLQLYNFMIQRWTKSRRTILLIIMHCQQKPSDEYKLGMTPPSLPPTKKECSQMLGEMLLGCQLHQSWFRNQHFEFLLSLSSGSLYGRNHQSLIYNSVILYIASFLFVCKVCGVWHQFERCCLTSCAGFLLLNL